MGDDLIKMIPQFLTYATINQMNMSQGLQMVFVYVNVVTGGLFMALVLSMIYFVFLTGIFFSQKSAQGYGSIGSASAVSGLILTIAAILLFLADSRLVSGYTIIECIFACVIGTIILFFIES